MGDSAVLLLLLLAVTISAWRTVLWRPRSLPGVDRAQPWLLGHRGLRLLEQSAAVPDWPRENTIEAFRKAFAAGLDGIECDVQQTLDGVLVLIHDETLGSASVTGSSFAALQELDPQLARLSELLELAAEFPGTVLNLELKLFCRRGFGIERRLARAVKAGDLGSRVLVSSFDPLALLRLRLWAPELRTALLCSPGMPAWLESGLLAGWLHVDALHPRFDQVDAAMIARARRRGLSVNSWTVNDESEVRRLTGLGVSGIIGDDPLRLKRAAGR